MSRGPLLLGRRRTTTPRPLQRCPISSSPPPFLALIIPAYNEEARLPASLEKAVAWLGHQEFAWEIRVVDDGSGDGTCGVVEEVSRREPRVLLQREPHRGKGGAVRAGMLQSKASLRFLCDADFSMPVEHVQRFLPGNVAPYDVAIASREVAGARRVGEPEHRHLMGRVFNALVRGLLVSGFQDTQCGFKCFTGDAAEVLFRQQTLDGWAFDVEILFLARRRGMQIVEVPIDWHYMDRSQVHPVRDTARMIEELLRIRWNALSGKYPR